MAAFVGVFFALIAVFEESLSWALFDRAVATNLNRPEHENLAEGLRIYLCGTGSPMPDAARGGPCIGILAGERAFVVDAGSGGVRTLARMGFPVGDIERVWLTHLHSDHIDGLGEMMLQRWINGTHQAPVAVAGPQGTARVVEGFNTAYEIDAGYRTAHHGPGIAPPSGFGAVAEEIEPGIVSSADDTRIRAVLVNHDPVRPAFAYRIDHAGRSVLISGDTVLNDDLIETARGVDVLLHDALQPRMVSRIADVLDATGQPHLAQIMTDIQDYHASPSDAARAAESAGADHLILYHIVPPLPSRLLEPAFLRGSKGVFGGPITIARDGMLVSLPRGSDRILLSDAF
ncbi:MBL fold metallo-hydrolase [Parasphingopyxis algicola]|uniref:MBL fold metallo-hydrolase n=1 Tax=Parasphingopyxis algicola TaxID=2026624 RepID=UPI001C40A18D|nr:MBL fold metallo-hydrolase [Parasphingopyxis algicola]